MLMQQRELRQMYFSKTRTGRCTATEFEVELSDEVKSGKRAPPNIPARPVTKEQHGAAFELFQEMVRNGVLSPSDVCVWRAHRDGEDAAGWMAPGD